MDATDTASATTTADRRAPLFTRPFLLLGLAELAYFTAEGVAVYEIGRAHV